MCGTARVLLIVPPHTYGVGMMCGIFELFFVPCQVNKPHASLRVYLDAAYLRPVGNALSVWSARAVMAESSTSEYNHKFQRVYYGVAEPEVVPPPPFVSRYFLEVASKFTVNQVTISYAVLTK